MASSPLGLTVAEVADRLGKSRATVYRWLSEGTAPPSYVVGGRRYFPEDKLDAWLDRLRRAAA
jgi:excisionase family DNA binding protein